ncbi:hypothetical protein ACWEO2_30695 [Nocardia sp. NPDC004278]
MRQWSVIAHVTACRKVERTTINLFNRLLAVSGIAGAVFTATVVGLAPQASARPFPEGVSCSGTSCRNDTDDTYLIEAWQHCRIIGTASETETPFNVVVRPHESVEVEGVKCPPHVTTEHSSLGDDFPSRTSQLPTEPTRIGYSEAVIYDPNAPKVRTGSAG